MIKVNPNYLKRWIASNIASDIRVTMQNLDIIIVEDDTIEEGKLDLSNDYSLLID